MVVCAPHGEQVCLGVAGGQQQRWRSQITETFAEQVGDHAFHLGGDVGSWEDFKHNNEMIWLIFKES